MGSPAPKNNPFEYQEPLAPDPGKDLRIERGASVRQALKLLRRGGFLTVSAPPYSGVTTFLYALREALPRTAFLDLANFSFDDDPPRRAAYALARAIREETPQFDLPEHPANIAAVLTAVARAQSEPSGHHELLTVIVDGFDAWSDEPARKLVLALRAAYTESRTRGSYRSGFSVITGSSVDLRDLTASGRTSPLNIAQHIFLSDFTPGEAAQLIGRGLAGRYEEEEIEAWVRHATQWASGHPALTQMIGYKAFERSAEDRTAEEAWESVLPILLEEATERLASTVGLLTGQQDLRKAASEVYSGAAVPCDRIHRPIRDLLHMGLIRSGEHGLCRPRNALYERVLASALNISAPNPSAKLWNTRASERLLRAPGTPAADVPTALTPSERSLSPNPFMVNPDGSTEESTPFHEAAQRTITPPEPHVRSGPPPPLLPPGAVLGGCRIIRRIGRGAMSEVFLAKHLGLNTDVAIKVLRHGSRDDHRIAQRFLREARAAARLSHENIVQIRNVGREGEYRFIEMEYLSGGSVADLLPTVPIRDIPRAVELLKGAAAGVQAAHAKGVVHRDIKPDNLMLNGEGKVKVVDFGLAAVLSMEESRLTQEGTILGTPHYMAPEQWEGRPVDERSDIYSLGATFYHLLTGRPPFDGKTIIELISNFTSRPLALPRKLNPAIPRRLDRLLVKMLKKDPSERYSRLDELLAQGAGL